jgi:hypothetical protein
MGIRETISQNPMIGIGIVVIAVGIVAWTMMPSSPKPGNNVSQTYFYNLESGEIVMMPTGTLPPATTESGQQAVQAHVYSCGDCTADQWFFYLETLTEEAKAALESVGEDDDPTFALQADQMGRMVAEAPAGGGDPQWALATSQQGMAIANHYTGKSKCGTKLPNICRP